MTGTPAAVARPATPSGCGLCGIEARRHPFGSTWIPGTGFHGYKPPAGTQILDRMRGRRAARLAELADPTRTQFHATAQWTGSHIPDDEGVMICADCFREDCPRLHRTQRRLDRARWGRPNRRGIPAY